MTLENNIYCAAYRSIAPSLEMKSYFIDLLYFTEYDLL